MKFAETTKIIACAVLGLGLGYGLGFLAKDNNRTASSVEEGIQRKSNFLSHDRSDQSGEKARRNRSGTRENQPAFTREQVDLLLEEPMRFRLTPDIIIPCGLSNQSPDQWLDSMSQFFGWNEQQRAEAGEELSAFAKDLRELVDQNAIIDDSDFDTIRVDLARVKGPFQDRVKEFRENFCDIVGSSSMARLDAAADIDRLSEALPAESSILLNPTVYESRDGTVVLALRQTKNGEERHRMNSFSKDDASAIMNNSPSRLDPFMPNLDWNRIITERLKDP